MLNAARKQMTANISFVNSHLEVVGELDFFTVVNLWNMSLPLLAKSPNLDIDLSKVTTANSAGLSLLIEWVKYAKRENKSIVFKCMPSQLDSIAKIAGVDQLLNYQI